jgi:hypothetical protein
LPRPVAPKTNVRADWTAVPAKMKILTIGNGCRLTELEPHDSLLA